MFSPQSRPRPRPRACAGWVGCRRRAEQAPSTWPPQPSKWPPPHCTPAEWLHAGRIGGRRLGCLLHLSVQINLQN